MVERVEAYVGPDGKLFSTWEGAAVATLTKLFEVDVILSPPEAANIVAKNWDAIQKIMRRGND